MRERFRYALLLALLTSCSLPRNGPADGGPSDGGPGDASPGDGGSEFAIAQYGQPCVTAGQKACESNNGSQPLFCSHVGVWEYGNACQGNTRCDARRASAQVGTCQEIVPVCIGRAPGDLVCSGTARVQCGADLVTTSDAPCGANASCLAGPAGAECACNPDHAPNESRACVKIDDCARTPCLNGGVCTDGDEQRTCDCSTVDYAGASCETKVDDCVDVVCPHGGVCVDSLRASACRPAALFKPVRTAAPPVCSGDVASKCLNGARNHVLVGDFNGDGRQDFASASKTFLFWFGQEDGSYSFNDTAPLPATCTSASACLSGLANHVFVGHFNDDLLTDFVTIGATIDAWLAAPDGTFRIVKTPAPATCATAAACVNSELNHVVVGDFNRDGNTDFMSANANFDAWYAKGDGTFALISTPPPSYCDKASDCLNSARHGVIVGDFNGDRRTDFLSANGSFDTWQAKPDGTFALSSTKPPPACAQASSCLSTQLNDVVVGDFNKDGRTDFLSAKDDFDVWIAGDRGVFTFSSRAVPEGCGTAAECLNSAPNAVIVGDFNNDGQTDFTSANQVFDTFLATDQGTFTLVKSPLPSGLAASTAVSAHLHGLVAGDVTGDGLSDFTYVGTELETWVAQAQW